VCENAEERKQMSTMESDLIEGVETNSCTGEDGGTRDLEHAQSASATTPQQLIGVVTGILIGFKDEGRSPLVLYAGQQGSAAVTAATAIDVHAAHVGGQVVLMFENGDARRPIIMGLLRTRQAWPVSEQPGQVEVDADGERLVVTAKEQLVLRCGKASITLTKAGKVLVQGTYVSSRSAGVMRIKGGSVQIN
jgi:Domain of unknown function (DUF6484)